MSTAPSIVVRLGRRIDQAPEHVDDPVRSARNRGEENPIIGIEILVGLFHRVELSDFCDVCGIHRLTSVAENFAAAKLKEWCAV